MTRGFEPPTFRLTTGCSSAELRHQKATEMTSSIAVSAERDSNPHSPKAAGLQPVVLTIAQSADVSMLCARGRATPTLTWDGAHVIADAYVPPQGLPDVRDGRS
jgi:hypothetical protein